MIQGGNRTRRDRAAGFTLIEIAIVLAVVALITAGVVALITPILKGAKIRATSANAELVKSALQLHLARYGRLPCPAVPAALTGLEDVAGCTNTLVPATTIARGVIPWVTLGLTSEQADDGYYRRFTYHVVVAQTTTNTTTAPGIRGEMTVHSAVPTTLGLAPTGNQINSCMNTAPPPAGGNDGNGCNLRAVVVLLSHGENGAGAFVATSGTALDAPTAAAELENTDADVAFVNSVTGAAFDDSVFYWSPDDLIGPMSRDGAMKSAASLSQDALRVSEAAVTNHIVATSTPGPPGTATAPATFSLATIGYGPPNDGWQQPIIYIKNMAVGDICSHATGTESAFTVRSAGVDQNEGLYAPTGRRDDIDLPVTVATIRNLIIKAGKACP